MLAIQKEPIASRVNGLDEILLRAILCKLVDNDAVAGQHILEQGNPFRPLNSGFLHPLIFFIPS